MRRIVDLTIYENNQQYVNKIESQSCSSSSYQFDSTICIKWHQGWL